jgi:hypothetical protein
MIVTIVTSLDLPNKSVISDTDRGYELEPGREYILHFTTGRVTLRAFKELYLLDRPICFYVANFEHLIHRLSFFKNCEFKFLRGEERRLASREEAYREVERGLVGRASDRGVELSFTPDVFRSARSSLMDPALYKAPQCTSSAIYRVLEKGMKYDELKEKVRAEMKKVADGPKRRAAIRILVGRRRPENNRKFDEEFDRALKSLVFTELVKRKDEVFRRS